jgi:hypothetical protein
MLQLPTAALLPAAKPTAINAHNILGCFLFGFNIYPCAMIRRHGYATMERPHLYFDGAPGTTTGRATHLSVAAPLDIGDEGCVDDVKGATWPESKCKRAPCSCQLYKYVSHAGSLLIALE